MTARQTRRQAVTHDVVVVGGGIIGIAIARELAEDGVGVLVLERGAPMEEASWAAAGILSPLAEAEAPGPFLRLLRESAALYPELSRSLLEETGVDVGYRREGTLVVAMAEREEAALENRLAWQRAAGLPVERLGGTEARDLEPMLSPGVTMALAFPEDHQVDTRALIGALARSALNRGVEIRSGRAVDGVVVSGGRVAGVRLAGGEVVEAAAVVIAAGSWSGRLEGLPRPLPVFPVHGQLLSLRMPEPRLTRVVHSERIYLVPRADGRLVVGATAEEIGFRKEVTTVATRRLLAGAVEAVPGLDGAALLEQWSGLRPGTPDGEPILGEDPEVSGLVYATGHYRNGILLAPVTAALLARAILSGDASPLAPFSIDRPYGNYDDLRITTYEEPSGGERNS